MPYLSIRHLLVLIGERTKPLFHPFYRTETNTNNRTIMENGQLTSVKILSSFIFPKFLSPPHGTGSHIRVQWCILKATFQNDCVIQRNKCRKQIMMPLRPPKYQFPPLTVFQSLQVFKNNTKAICLRT